jgi:hypothetical protein
VTLYAIDPGTEQSAVVTVRDGAVSGQMWENRELVRWLAYHSEPSSWNHLIVEQIESYGMAVGREVFETVFWSGRFVQAWTHGNKGTFDMLPRKVVKLALCGSPRAKDTNIRQALIDRYGGSPCIKKGGALYGIKSHLWAALALAETYRIQHVETVRS